jgi:hypothetical protein
VAFFHAAAATRPQLSDKCGGWFGSLVQDTGIDQPPRHAPNLRVRGTARAAVRAQSWRIVEVKMEVKIPTCWWTGVLRLLRPGASGGDFFCVFGPARGVFAFRQAGVRFLRIECLLSHDRGIASPRRSAFLGSSGFVRLSDEAPGSAHLQGRAKDLRVCKRRGKSPRRTRRALLSRAPLMQRHPRFVSQV